MICRESKCWFRENRHQEDSIVWQILFLVNDELCKIELSKGIVWPKNPEPKFFLIFYLGDKLLDYWVGKIQGMKGKKVVCLAKKKSLQNHNSMH